MVSPMIKINSSKVLVLENDTFSIEPKKLGYHPVFARKWLQNNEMYSVMITKKGICAIGLATADLRNKTNHHNHINSFCLSLDGKLWSGGS